MMKKEEQFKSVLEDFIQKSIQEAEERKYLHSLFIIIDFNTKKVYSSNSFNLLSFKEEAFRTLDISEQIKGIKINDVAELFKETTNSFKEKLTTISEVDENILFSVFYVNFLKIEVGDYPPNDKRL